MWYSHSHPWDKSTLLCGQIDLPSCKHTNKQKNLNNELSKELKTNMQQRGQCPVSIPGKG
jgi:hypothetical protein